MYYWQRHNVLRKKEQSSGETGEDHDDPWQMRLEPGTFTIVRGAAHNAGWHWSETSINEDTSHRWSAWEH